MDYEGSGPWLEDMNEARSLLGVKPFEAGMEDDSSEYPAEYEIITEGYQPRAGSSGPIKPPTGGSGAMRAPLPAGLTAEWKSKAIEAMAIGLYGHMSISYTDQELAEKAMSGLLSHGYAIVLPAKGPAHE